MFCYLAPQESIGIELTEHRRSSIFRSRNNFEIDREDSVLTDEGSLRYEPESSHTSEMQIRTSSITSSISRSQSFLPDVGSPRYASSECSSRYSESPRYSPAQITTRPNEINSTYGLVTNEESPTRYASPTLPLSRQTLPGTPTDLFEYENSSPRYAPSPEPGQAILGTTTNQRDQMENFFSQYLPKQDQTYGDASPRYSPCDF